MSSLYVIAEIFNILKLLFIGKKNFQKQYSVLEVSNLYAHIGC